MLLYVHRDRTDYQGRPLHFHTAPECCFTSTEIVRTIRDGEPRTATSTFTASELCLKFNVALHPQRPYIGTIMDGKPRAATSTFTQLLSSEEGFGSVLLYVHRNRKDGKPSTAISTFTQLLNSGELLSSIPTFKRRGKKGAYQTVITLTQKSANRRRGRIARCTASIRTQGQLQKTTAPN